MKLPLDRRQVEEIIPHRRPFLLVDRILELVPGERAVGEYTVVEDDCLGHFPGNPVMPGVKLIEAMNQVGAVALLCSDEFAGKVPAFRGIQMAKILKPAKPGDKLIITVNRTKDRGPVGKCEGKISLNGETVAFATVTFIVVDSL